MRRRTLLVAGGAIAVGLSGYAFRDVDMGGGDDGSGSTTTVPADARSATPTPDPGPTPTDPGLDDDSFEVALGFEREPTLWSVDHRAFERTRQYALRGSYSGGLETERGAGLVARAAPGVIQGGVTASTVRVAWYELSGNDGGGLVVENSDGNTEVFVGTSGPEWVVAGGETPDALTVIDDRALEGNWVRADLSFDWRAGTVTAAVGYAETGGTVTATVDLATGQDVAQVALTGFDTDRFTAGDGFVADSCAMYWDDVQVEG